MKTEYKELRGKHIGIGGFKCYCCNPWKSKQAKQLTNRYARRKLKQIKVTND